MKVYLFLSLVLFSSCQTKKDGNKGENLRNNDSLSLLQLVMVREKAMREKDIKTIMTQFRDDATWINSGGFYFRNKHEIERFHTNLIHMDTVGYTYKAGKPTVKILNAEFAIVYYPWEMDWYRIASPKDTMKEVGLMSLTAQKDHTGWKWNAVTNQHTEEYFDHLETHIFKEMIK